MDGSLSPSFISQRSAARGIPLPVGVSDDGTGLREYLHNLKLIQIKQGHRTIPVANWDVFEYCNQFLQTYDELKVATTDILTRYHKENVKLCELRFCPTLHCREGLTEKEAVLAVVEGFNLMRIKYNIIGGVILCGLRSHTSEQTLNVAKCACELVAETNGAVLGYDIAGDEGTYRLIWIVLIMQMILIVYVGLQYMLVNGLLMKCMELSQ